MRVYVRVLRLFGRVCFKRMGVRVAIYVCVKMYVYVERMSLCVYASGECVCVIERKRERKRENECVYLSVMFPKFTTNVFRIVVSPLFSLKQISTPH